MNENASHEQRPDELIETSIAAVVGIFSSFARARTSALMSRLHVARLFAARPLFVDCVSLLVSLAAADGRVRPPDRTNPPSPAYLPPTYRAVSTCLPVPHPCVLVSRRRLL